MHGVQPVAQLSVVALEQVAVAVQGEATEICPARTATSLGWPRPRSTARPPYAEGHGCAALQAGRPGRRPPHSRAEVRGPQRATLVGGEHEGIRLDRPAARCSCQRLHHDPRQSNPAPTGPSSLAARVQLAMNLGHHLGDLDRPGSRSSRLRRSPAISPMRGRHRHRAGSAPDSAGRRHGQAADLGHGQEPHLVSLDPGQRDRPAWRAREHVGAHRRGRIVRPRS